jgi:hypothetical protein
LDAPSIGRLHTLSEERAFIVTGRDSVPVAISAVAAISVAAAVSIAIAVAVYVAAHDDGGTSFVEASSVEATTSLMEATAPGVSALSRSRVCARCSEGGEDE